MLKIKQITFFIFFLLSFFIGKISYGDLYLKEYGFYGVIEDENGKTYDGYDIQISQNFTIATDTNGKECKTQSKYFENVDNLEASQHGIINLNCMLSENTKYQLTISKEGKIIKTFDFTTSDKKTLTIGKDGYNTFLFGIYSLDKISYLFSDEVKKQQEYLSYNNPDFISKYNKIQASKLFNFTFFCNSNDGLKRKLNDNLKYEIKNQFQKTIEKGLISEQLLSIFLYPGDIKKIYFLDGSNKTEINVNYNDNNTDKEIILKNCDDKNSKVVTNENDSNPIKGNTNSGTIENTSSGSNVNENNIEDFKNQNIGSVIKGINKESVNSENYLSIKIQEGYDYNIILEENGVLSGKGGEQFFSNIYIGQKGFLKILKDGKLIGDIDKIVLQDKNDFSKLLSDKLQLLKIKKYSMYLIYLIGIVSILFLFSLYSKKRRKQ